MRWFALPLISVCVLSACAQAHHPDRANKPVRQYVDVVPPLGNRLPMSHRRKLNRPRNIGGHVAYYIAPSSQEAMAWHDATHRGLYKNDRPRMLVHYFYPKPWEALKFGRSAGKTAEIEDTYGETSVHPVVTENAADLLPAPMPSESAIVGDRHLIE